MLRNQLCPDRMQLYSIVVTMLSGRRLPSSVSPARRRKDSRVAQNDARVIKKYVLIMR
jgi:hypothetical protein